MRISYSRFSTYLKCPYKHYLAYYEELEAKKPVRALYFGTAFHKLLQYRKDPILLAKAKEEIGEEYYDLDPKWQQELGEDFIVELAAVLEDYSYIYQDAKLPTQTERPFELTVDNYKGEPIIFNGIIDEVYKYKHEGEKCLKLADHKTFTRAPHPDVMLMNTQKLLYIKAMEIITGVTAKSFMWDYIKSEPAQMPIWLPKSKKFSEAKSQRITPFSWRRACVQRSITDPEILRLGNQYANNIPNYFFRREEDTIPAMVDSVWEGFLYTSRDIVRQGHKNKTKNMSPDCAWCVFRNICLAELTGSDAEYVKEQNYKHRIHKDENQEESE